MHATTRTFFPTLALALAGACLAATAFAESIATDWGWNEPDIQPDIPSESEIISDVELELPWKGDPDWANWPFQNACWAETCADAAKVCANTWGCKELLVCADWGKQACEAQPASWPAEYAATWLIDCGNRYCDPAKAMSCKYRCGKWTSLADACQCDPGCAARGDCCVDHTKFCPVGPDTSAGTDIAVSDVSAVDPDSEVTIDPPDGFWAGDSSPLADAGGSAADTVAKSSTPSAADGCGAGRRALNLWPLLAALALLAHRRGRTSTFRQQA